MMEFAGYLYGKIVLSFSRRRSHWKLPFKEISLR